MFIYEDGILVGYDHLANNFYHRTHGCPKPNVCSAVEDAMVGWARSLPGQPRVRLGKVGIMQGSEVNLKRMENE